MDTRGLRSVLEGGRGGDGLNGGKGEGKCEEGGYENDDGLRCGGLVDDGWCRVGSGLRLTFLLANWIKCDLVRLDKLMVPAWPSNRCFLGRSLFRNVSLENCFTDMYRYGA